VLNRYVDDNGDARVPTPSVVAGFRPGQWVSSQRQLHRKGTLDANRVQRLQEVPGWVWKA